MKPSGVPELLPRLRRFARVLTGSQQVGDAYVSVAVSDLIDGKFPGIPARIALHSAVLKQVDATNVIPVSDRHATRDPVQRNLSSLTPVGRQAYMLVTLEKFSLRKSPRVCRGLQLLRE